MVREIDEWRARNASRVLERAKRHLRNAHKPVDQLRRTHPRLLHIISDHGSWHDAEEMQEMWAGLLVSSSLGEAYDESNLVFVGILSQMTLNEVHILNHACLQATKVVSMEGIIVAEQLEYTLNELMRIAQVPETFCLDIQLDHLRALGLFPVGINLQEEQEELVADITPSSLALYMFVRCHGGPGSPNDYFMCL